MAIVGQINASPSINIEFRTLATTAIQRSERGTVCLILKDKKATQKWYTFKTIADVESKNWDAKSIKYINLAMHYGAFKVLVRVVQNEEAMDKVLKDLEMKKFNWLAYPGAIETEDQTIVNWVKQQFGTTGPIGKTVKYVSSYANRTDHVAIVELGNGGTYKSIYGDFTAQEYTAAIAGLIAGFIHSSVALNVGIVYKGLNLYNNGFAGGIVAIFMVPVIESIIEKRKNDKEKKLNKS